MDGENTVKQLQEANPRGRREKEKTWFRVDGLCRIGFEEYGCKRWINKSFGQNRKGIRRGGSQGKS
jgi:hypothetical protein